MVRSRASLLRAVLTALTVIASAACSPAASTGSPTTAGEQASAPVPRPTASPVDSISPAADVAAAPTCSDRQPPAWLSDASHPWDGTPDPMGRIVFGQVAYVDDLIGPVIAPMFAMDADGSDLVQILDCEVLGPRLSPDGSHLTFSVIMDDGTTQVATSAADGSDLRVLTSTAGYATAPDWSPDGSWIVYENSTEPCVSYPACTDDGTTHPTLWRVDADGSDARLIGAADAVDTEPHISPDGLALVYDHLDPSSSRFTFMIRDLATGKDRRVFSADRDLEHASWSTDGHSIVYNTLSGADGQFLEQIQRSPADDPTATPVVLYGDLTHTAYKPTYSADGSSILFGCDGDICRMDADGGNVTVVIEDVPGNELNYPIWGPSSTPSG